ncbi:hypothetical protein BGX38DRAFT_1266841 [Terfezia claveryi]|nr:hypothetical protein BGX38DRAFT_1266841 [Terfezia claveryi]
MPSKFGIRKHIRQLFHHSSRKFVASKAGLPNSSSTTEQHSSPPQLGGTHKPYEPHHPSPAPDHINIIQAPSYNSPRKIEPHIGVCLAHPDSEIPATPIGEEPPTFASQQRNEYINRTREFSDLPPEAINVLSEPPQLEVHSSDKASLALGSASLRLRSQGQQPSSSFTRSSIHQGSVKGEMEGSSSVDSKSVYSRNTESPQGSNAPSDNLNHPELPSVEKHKQEHCESPVLGWPKLRSENAAVDHLILHASQESPEDQKDYSLRDGDSGFWDRRLTLGTYASDQYRRENFQWDDSTSAQLWRESLSQGPSQPSPQGNETPHLFTTTYAARQSLSGTGLPPAYHHDAEIYHTHVPSVTHSIDKHVGYNFPIIHERTIPQHREIRHEHITRDIHTYEIKPALQPVVKPEYLTPKHVVQLEGGETRDITAREATSGNYLVVNTENRVIVPASVRNIDEYSEQVRDMDTSSRGPSRQEGEGYSPQEHLEEVQYRDRRGTFGNVP